VMTTLNGLTRSWDAFIQGICSRRKLPKFSSLWEYFNQEEGRTTTREEKTIDDYKSLASNTRKGKSKKEPSSPKKFQKGQRNNPNIICLCCQKMGHITRNCSLIQRPREKKGGKRHHVHTVEDDEPPKKVENEYESSDEEYVLISSLIGTVTRGSDIWLVDSGTSKHMTGYKDSLSNLTHKDSPHKMKLGDDYQYLIKGVGETSYKLDSGNPMKMKEVLYVLGLRKNPLSISTLDEKGYRVAFVDGQVHMWHKGNTFDDVVMIGVQDEGLYKLKGKSD
jgi:hypothetical protein